MAAAIIVDCVTAWLATGVLVGVAFLFLGIDRVDHAARGAYAFRPLLLPGLVLLWPFVAVALVRAGAVMRRRHRDVHRVTWLVLAFLLPAIVLLSLMLRPIGPTEAPQIQLAPPK